LLNFHGGCYLFVLPECADLFHTNYLLNFPTNRRNKVLNQGNAAATLHSVHRQHRAVLPNLSYELLQNLVGKHRIAFLLLAWEKLIYDYVSRWQHLLYRHKRLA
jgi:hypothetical protein